MTSGVQPGGCAEAELEDGEFAAAQDRARAKLMHCEPSKCTCGRPDGVSSGTKVAECMSCSR